MAGIEVHRLYLGGWGELEEHATVDLIVNYLEENVPLDDIDVLYDSGGFLSFFYLVAYRLKRRHQFAFVVHYRYLMAKDFFGPTSDSDPWNTMQMEWDTVIVQATQGFPCRFADAVACPAGGDARFVERSYLPEHEAFVLPEPVEELELDSAAVQALRAELAAPHETLCLFTGRITDALKGARFVNAAFAALANRPDIRLLVLLKEESEADEFKVIQERAIIRPWIVDRQELMTTLAAADVVLMPSTYESFGLVCAEALTAGTPVIASPVGGVPDMIRHEHNGFLLGANTQANWPTELAHWIRLIADNPTVREQLQEHARATSLEFSPQRVLATCEAICKTAVERNHQRARCEVRVPELSVEDRQRYFTVLRRFLGKGSEELGEAVLENWHRTATERCVTCTRQRLARDTLRLYELKPRRPRWFFPLAGEAWLAARRDAVEKACPLGLVQRTHFKDS